jgi:hypothetical protein
MLTFGMVIATTLLECEVIMNNNFMKLNRILNDKIIRVNKISLSLYNALRKAGFVIVFNKV